MPGFMDRLKTIFGAKADAAIDKLEDPRETLDYSYQRQLELLKQVRKGVADISTSRKRLEMQVQSLNEQVAKYDDAARRALELNREDLAREALTRKAGVVAQLDDLQRQYAQLQAEEEKLVRSNQQLQAKVDAFRTKKETIKATYSAAEAQTKINDAYAGLGSEMGDIGRAIERAEDKTAQLQARASAVDELMAAGVLSDGLGGPGDDIERELSALSADSSVDRQLEALKAQMGQIESAPAQPAAAIEAGDEGAVARPLPSQADRA